MINAEKYDDDEDAWYYADGSGNLYAGEFKTIKGKKYAFRNDGRMLSGLKFILENDNDLLVKLMMMEAIHLTMKMISLPMQLIIMRATVISATISVTEKMAL